MLTVADEFVPFGQDLREDTAEDGREEWADAHFFFALKSVWRMRARRLFEAGFGFAETGF